MLAAMKQISSPNSRSDLGSCVFDLTGAHPAADLFRAVARFLGGFREGERSVESCPPNFPDTRYDVPNQSSGVRMDAQFRTGRRERLLPPVEGGVFVSDLVSGELEHHDYRLVVSVICTTCSAFLYLVIVTLVGIVIAFVVVGGVVSRLIFLDHASQTLVFLP